jgi:protein gp37
MAQGSGIEWTEATWNPLTGCTKISPGCEHCYAERLSLRLQAMGRPKYAKGFELALHEDVLEQPLGWKRAQMIFVNSMSDLFHEDVPPRFIHDVFDVMRRASWHTFQVLTKRSGRLARLAPEIDWPENVWMGVSVESIDWVHRIQDLKNTGARVKFISLEPLLGPLPGLNLTSIDWIIVGGESGPGARPIREEWIIDIRDQCRASDIPFFFKQWGGTNKKRSGRTLDGRVWDARPVSLGLAAVYGPSNGG